MPGVTVADVARKHGTTRWQIYDWRKQIRKLGHAGLAGRHLQDVRREPRRLSRHHPARHPRRPPAKRHRRPHAVALQPAVKPRRIGPRGGAYARSASGKGADVIHPPKQDESQNYTRGNPHDSGFWRDALENIEMPVSDVRHHYEALFTIRQMVTT